MFRSDPRMHCHNCLFPRGSRGEVETVYTPILTTYGNEHERHHALYRGKRISFLATMMPEEFEAKENLVADT